MTRKIQKQDTATKVVKTIDPESQLSKASIRPDELTIDDLYGSVIRLADGEVFWKIPGSDFILSRFDSQYVSRRIEKDLDYFVYTSLLDGLRCGKLRIANGDTIDGDGEKNNGVRMMLMNPDQWSISAYRLVDQKDVDFITDLVKHEDNLLTLERALEIESSEHKRTRVIDLLNARITAVKKA